MRAPPYRELRGKSFRAGIALSGALVAGSLAGGSVSAPAAADEPARPLGSSFSATTLAGERISLDDYAGRVVVLAFWATWCHPCLDELPHLNALAERLGEQGLTVIAVSGDGPETASRVRGLVRREGWSFPVVIDSDGAIGRLYNPQDDHPFTAYLDRTHRVAYTHVGYEQGDEAGIAERVEALLGEPAP